MDDDDRKFTANSSGFGVSIKGEGYFKRYQTILKREMDGSFYVHWMPIRTLIADEDNYYHQLGSYRGYMIVDNNKTKEKFLRHGFGVMYYDIQLKYNEIFRRNVSV